MRDYFWTNFSISDVNSASYPKYNIVTIDQEISKLQILAPGWKKEDIQVKFKDNRLKISANPISDKDVTYSVKGFSTKGFEIEFAINYPSKVHSVTLEKGILEVEIHKESEEEYVIPVQ